MFPAAKLSLFSVTIAIESTESVCGFGKIGRSFRLPEGKNWLVLLSFTGALLRTALIFRLVFRQRFLRALELHGICNWPKPEKESLWIEVRVGSRSKLSVALVRDSDASLTMQCLVVTWHLSLSSRVVVNGQDEHCRRRDECTLMWRRRLRASENEVPQTSHWWGLTCTKNSRYRKCVVNKKAKSISLFVTG
jgi:hypothetical protein